MGLSQALSSALAGVNTTQLGLTVIAGNVANANTPGYVEEQVNQVEVTATGQNGASVAVDGINRNLNTLLQSQLWTESSGGSYADTTSQLYQQLQQIYGTPGSSGSLDSVYSDFTTALQGLSTSPSSYSAQEAVVGAAQTVTQNLNSMTTSIQQLRTQTEQGIANDVQTANGMLQQIAQINTQLSGSVASGISNTVSTDSSTAVLEDQRDQDISQLAQLMNVRVVQNPNNQISVFAGNGQQLVAGNQASTLSFNNMGSLSATQQWSATASQDGVGTITLTSPSGSTSDLVAEQAFQSGQIGAYLQMRDTVLPQAQNQLDEMANQMSQALSNQTTSGTAVTSGSQAGFSVDIGNVIPGNSLQLTYTDSLNVQHNVTVVALGTGGTLPASTPGSTNQVIGINFAAGAGSVASQLNAALGSNLQFSNPSGTVLQVLNAGTGNTVTSFSATTTATSLQNGSPQFELFTDGSQAITGAQTADGSQTTGLAGRITVNAALANSPSSLVSYAANTSSGDTTRPDFLLNQMSTASLTFSPSTGLGSASAPYSGTLTQYMSQVVSQQAQAATAASNLQQGQDTVVTALQQRFNSQSGVSIDTEMSNLIALQNAYSANARVMSTVQQMMQTLLQVMG
ncbi:MAG TPA: flagellar hook-associated protein FlgK [Xanthobacteraceae bacterium]|jgi:flagellar hook-associated protein 1 FlgK|nr:flagellar hook-associated protein FlgK [Xanthobacteraceae bacterium]